MQGVYIFFNNPNKYSFKIQKDTSPSSYTKIDCNTIMVGNYKAIRQNTTSQNTKITGKVVEFIEPTKTRSMNNIGNMNLILSGLSSKVEITSKNGNKQDIFTEKNGTFSINTPKEELKLTFSKPTDTNTTLKPYEKVTIKLNTKDNQTDLGIIQLTRKDNHNYKLDLSYAPEFIYADGTKYSVTLRLNNVSNVMGKVLTYKLQSPSPYVADIEYPNIQASINAGSYQQIPIKISFHKIPSLNAKIPIYLTAKDMNGHVWQDLVYLSVYQQKATFTIMGAIRGYIISPWSNTIQHFSNGGSFTKPISNKPYRVVVYGNETAYSIGIEKDAPRLKGQINPHLHEPNDKQADAKSIEYGTSVVSYLHNTDIDYWDLHVNKLKEYDVNGLPLLTTGIYKNTNTKQSVYYKLVLKKDGGIATNWGGFLYSSAKIYSQDLTHLHTFVYQQDIPKGTYIVEFLSVYHTGTSFIEVYEQEPYENLPKIHSGVYPASKKTKFYKLELDTPSKVNIVSKNRFCTKVLDLEKRLLAKDTSVNLASGNYILQVFEGCPLTISIDSL